MLRPGQYGFVVADETLRALERRFRESGSEDDHVRWLAARLRTCALSEARVRLAADLGHVAARRVLAVAAVPLESGLREIEGACRAAAAPAAHADAHWVLTGEPAPVSALHDQGMRADEVGARALRALLPFALGLTATPDPRLERGLARLQEWLACPCTNHAADLRAETEEPVQVAFAAVREWFPVEDRARIDELVVEAQRRMARGLRRDATPAQVAAAAPTFDPLGYLRWPRDTLFDAVSRTAEGASFLSLRMASRAPWQYGTWQERLMPLIRLLAVFDAEATLRASIVAVLGPWLLLEE